MKYAGVGLRAVAVIIDSVILFFLAYLTALFTGSTTKTGFELQGGPFFLLLLISFGYYIVMEAVWAGTLGKLLIGLRVVKEDGSKIDWSKSLIRNVLRLVDGLFFYLVAAILVWQSQKRQRLGDRIAGTVVIKQRKQAEATTSV